MLGYISTIMVTMLMIRAIYFKWVIIGGRLHLAMAMRALTDILPSGNSLAMMSCRSAPAIVCSHSPLVSPHLIVSSPLCPLLQFTNRVSGAVKCRHSAAQQRSSEY